MPRTIAYLRAINVGGHTVKMDALRAHFEALGLVTVETFIASGNVIFDAPPRANAAALEARIEKHLHGALGYEVATFLRNAAENAAAAVFEPFSAAQAAAAHNTYVAFLKAPVTQAQKNAVLAFKSAVDDFAINGRELYWLCTVPSIDSKFSAARLEKVLGAPVTMRNTNTVRKLAAKYPEKTK
jgi:uncharacterized protein (DUF1697 family)